MHEFNQLFQLQTALLIHPIGQDHHCLPDVLGGSHVAERRRERVIKRRTAAPERSDRWRLQTLLGGEHLEGSDYVGKRHEENLVFGKVAANERIQEGSRPVQLAAEIHGQARIYQDGKADRFGFRFEERDLLRPAVLQKREVGSCQAVHMVPSLVGHLNGYRLEIGVDLKNRRLRLSQRRWRASKQKSRRPDQKESG